MENNGLPVDPDTTEGVPEGFEERDLFFCDTEENTQVKIGTALVHVETETVVGISYDE